MADAATRRAAPAWTTLAVCCIAQFMVVLDISIVNVALPQMRTDLGLSVADQQWVINAYTLTFAGFLMLGGRLADLFGRKRVFSSGLALFTVCSLLGGLAQSGTWLIAARAAQGIGGAVLAPATLSLLITRYQDLHERRRALGAWSATAASGSAIGVLAGGVLTDILDWRWVLFVNVPIGAALLVAALVGLDESKNDQDRARLDLPGAFTITAGLAVVVYGIVDTDVHPWGSARTIVTLAVGVVLLGAFGLIEARLAAEPVVPLQFFRRRSVAVASGVGAAVGAALFSSYFFLSLFMQEVAGYSPLKAGLAFLPSGLASFLGARVGTRLVAVMGVRRQLMLAPMVGAAGVFWLVALSPSGTYLGQLFGPMILFGFGLGMTFVPMTLAATGGVPPRQSGLASGLITTTRQMGGAVGLAALATVATSVASHHRPGRAATEAALTHGYAWAFGIAGGALVVGAAVASLLPRAPASPAASAQAEAAASAPAEG